MTAASFADSLARYFTRREVGVLLGVLDDKDSRAIYYLIAKLRAYAADQFDAENTVEKVIAAQQVIFDDLRVQQYGDK